MWSVWKYTSAATCKQLALCGSVMPSCLQSVSASSIAAKAPLPSASCSRATASIWRPSASSTRWPLWRKRSVPASATSTAFLDCSAWPYIADRSVRQFASHWLASPSSRQTRSASSAYCRPSCARSRLRCQLAMEWSSKPSSLLDPSLRHILNAPAAGSMPSLKGALPCQRATERLCKALASWALSPTSLASARERSACLAASLEALAEAPFAESFRKTLETWCWAAASRNLSPRSWKMEAAPRAQARASSRFFAPRLSVLISA
mmetsp:Transcript_72025/g.211012  ORF Transcript_72025/g.211012 Transcript_72025/m.211012 type:complete len:264 (+) Transcript_72025:958-1749(+)